MVPLKKVHDVRTSFTVSDLTFYLFASYKATLNAFMALGFEAWTEARRTLQMLLSANESTLRDDVSLRSRSVWRSNTY